MKILITGGAGFIGSNLAAELSKEHEVTVFDSLERRGSGENLNWLWELEKIDKKARSLEFVKGEITDFGLVRKLVKEADAVLHLAAQTAVTNSVKNPRRDFEVNAGGTFNVLEAARQAGHKPLIIYSSTNKVYGKIAEDGLAEEKTRYVDKKHPQGISEEQPLDFYSPYGCSKGAADSYVKDYGRIYDLPTVVLRKSCVYGVRQFGTEDQGWVAHFARRALNNEPITIYGNGKQVRDLLYIDDLVFLYKKIINRRKSDKNKFRDEVYNIGGGRKNAVSLLELIDMLELKTGRKLKIKYDKRRAGDQKVYISNISKARREFDWQPRIGLSEGLDKLISWFKTIKE